MKKRAEGTREILTGQFDKLFGKGDEEEVLCNVDGMLKGAMEVARAYKKIIKERKEIEKRKKIIY